MTTLYKNCKLAIHGELVEKELLVEDGVIKAIGNGLCGDEEVDCEGKTIYPKLIDQHTHGGGGYDFTLASLDEMRKLIEFYREQKVGTVFPTLMTDSKETMLSQLDKIVELSKECPEVKGVHAEGPFLSHEYKGATPENYIQIPNMEMAKALVEHGKGLLRLVTISPELENAKEVIAYFVENGVRVNLGHSGATSAITKEAMALGANGFTHTFNAMRPIHHHEIGISGYALLSDGYCEAICDGRHLKPDTVRLMLKIKGLDRLVLVTDSIMAAGLPDGEYRLGANRIKVIDGDAQLWDLSSRAGSTLKAFDGVQNFAKFTGLPLEKAIVPATESPASYLGLNTGVLEEGKLAEFFML